MEDPALMRIRLNIVIPQEKTMTDPISTLRGLCKESKGRDEELRAGFALLEETVAAATKGVDVYGISDNCSLESYGDDDAIYGHLFFSGTVLQVAHRSTEDDMTDALNSDRLNSDRFEPTFSITTPRVCRAVWLRALAAPAVVGSLVNSITEPVRRSVDTAASVVSKN